MIKTTTPTLFGITLAFVMATSHATAQSRLKQPGPGDLPSDLFATVHNQAASEPVAFASVADPDSAWYKQQKTFVLSDQRQKVIHGAARGVGIRAGFMAEAGRINALLSTKYRGVLDQAYPFKLLMLADGHLVPPVISQSSDVEELSGPNFLYLTNGSYEIVKDARLATLAPDWRDYLLLPIKEPRPPSGISLQDEDEKEFWSVAVKEGWEKGVEEARHAFMTGINIATRDILGMQRYHQLAEQGAVSLPDVDVQRQLWRVNGDGTRAFQSEQIIKLRVTPSFKRGAGPTNQPLRDSVVNAPIVQDILPAVTRVAEVQPSISVSSVKPATAASGDAWAHLAPIPGQLYHRVTLPIYGE